MKCKKIKRLLFFKKNELTENEQRKLFEHLKHCETCRLDSERFKEQNRVTDSLISSPTLEDPNALTHDILQSIRFLTKFSKRRANPIDKVLDMFALKPVRLAFASCLVLVIALFIAQEILILNRLKTLEHRLVQQDTTVQNVYTEAAKNVLSHFNQSKEQLVIDRELMGELLNSYGELQMKNRLLLRVLEEQAEQANITWRDGLTDEELDQLFQGDRIKQKLKEL